ncbi:uncharacterized protein LOC126843634 [Adelges cooleyi]|uniref:uncharacterized protein LOC126843634 n=1 Tax=Adelges cooleyi TaxID=133065 RepID=UPI00217F72D7|nr:uncharacterized protein LOC126843634 [Adelges cooleyi]
MMENKTHVIPKNYGPKATLAQSLATIAQSFLLIGLGMELTIPTLVIGDLYQDKSEGFRLSTTEASWFGSILYVCHPTGSFLSGFLQERFGRKRCMLMANVPSILGWILLYFTESTTMLYAASLSMGMSIGFSEAPILSYVGEITEPRLRGSMASIASLSSMIGMLLISILGFFFPWRTVALLSTMCPVLCICFVSFIPESPMWLIAQGQTEKAEKAICWLRGWVEPSVVKGEFHELVRYNLVSGTQNGETPAVSKPAGLFHKLALFKDPLVYRPLRLVMVFFFFSLVLCLVPCRPFLYRIFINIGLTEHHDLLLVFLSVLQIVACSLTILTVSRVGKRCLTMLTLFTNTIAIFSFGIYIIATKNNYISPAPWMPFTLISLIYFFGAYGIACMPWILLSEIYSNESRGVATGASAAFSYLLIFVLTKSYLTVELYLTLELTMILFGVIGIFGILYLYYYLPETENKTFLEIEEFFLLNKRLCHFVVLFISIKQSSVQTVAIVAQSFLLINLGMELMISSLVLGDLYNGKDKDRFSLTISQASWYGSILFICHPPGSLVSGFLQERFGRKRCMIVANIPSVIGWILLHLAGSPTMLYSSTLTMGLSIGFSEAPIFSYIGEITEPRIRGSLSSVANTGTSVGMVLISILGCFYHWKYIALLSASCPLLCICLVLVIPESPIWLITQGKTEEAKKSLRWLRGWVEEPVIEEEFRNLVHYSKVSGTGNGETARNNTGMFCKIKMFKNPLVYRPLRMVLIFFFFSQIVSVIPCRPYVKNLMTEAGLVDDQDRILALLSVIQITPCFLTIVTLKRFGKRFLALFTLSTNTVAILAFGGYTVAIKNGYTSPLPLIPLTLLCLIYFFSAYGVICVPWMLISEIYPNEIRGVATGASAAFSYLLIFFSTSIYLTVKETFQEYTMILFGVIGIIGNVYLYYYLPETENKTLLEIEDFFTLNKRVH